MKNTERLSRAERAWRFWFKTPAKVPTEMCGYVVRAWMSGYHSALRDAKKAGKKGGKK